MFRAPIPRAPEPWKSWRELRIHRPNLPRSIACNFNIRYVGTSYMCGASLAKQGPLSLGFG
jgi:hypothetical protein